MGSVRMAAKIESRTQLTGLSTRSEDCRKIEDFPSGGMGQNIVPVFFWGEIADKLE